MTGLRMNVSDLLHRPGSSRAVHLEVPVAGLEGPSARVGGEDLLSLDLRLESLAEGILASGRVGGRWSAACSRCLAPVTQGFDVGLTELFEHDPVEDETYPLEHEEIDLEQPVRDTVVLELPLIPLCRPDCLGLCPTCGIDRNETLCECPGTPADVRWARLGELEL
jgi:DUF177 domain-containing protein